MSNSFIDDTPMIVTPRASRFLRLAPVHVGGWLTYAVPLLVPFLVFSLWWVAAERHWMSPQVLPTPKLVFETAQELFADNLFPNLWVSLQRLGFGLSIGVLGGAILGVVMGLSRRAEVIVYPTFLALVQIPTLAWIPLLMALLGLGEALKIAIIIKAVLAPIAIHTHVGVRDVDPRLTDAARVMRLAYVARLTHLVLPAALPSFLTGFRLALAQAWTSLLAVELLASSEGIGFLMVWGRQLFQLDIVFVCIFVIGAVGFAMDRLAQGIEQRVVRWPRPALAEQRGAAPRGVLALAFILPLALLTLWATVSKFQWVDVRILPPPVEVAQVLVGGMSDGSLIKGLALSLSRAFLGLAVGGSAGLSVGLLLGLLPQLDRLFGSMLTVLRLVALFAWLPLLTAWVGLGEPAKIVFVALACFFPMQVATQRGVANLSVQLRDVSRTLRLPVLARLRFVVLPGVAPSIFAGFRLALIVSWIATMGAEYFMSSGGGIGSLMINAQQLFRIDVVMAAMVLVGLTAAVLSSAGRMMERRTTRWRQS